LDITTEQEARALATLEDEGKKFKQLKKSFTAPFYLSLKLNSVINIIITITD